MTATSAPYYSNMKNFLPLLLLLTMSIESRASDLKPTVPGCEEFALPDGARIIGTPNGPVPHFAFFPASVAADFTGCTYAWMFLPEPTLYLVAKFENGRLIQSSSSAKSRFETWSTCQFPNFEKYVVDGCKDEERFWRRAYPDLPLWTPAPKATPPRKETVGPAKISI